MVFRFMFLNRNFLKRTRSKKCCCKLDGFMSECPLPGWLEIRLNLTHDVLEIPDDNIERDALTLLPCSHRPAIATFMFHLLFDFFCTGNQNKKIACLFFSRSCIMHYVHFFRVYLHFFLFPVFLHFFCVFSVFCVALLRISFCPLIFSLIFGDVFF